MKNGTEIEYTATRVNVPDYMVNGGRYGENSCNGVKTYALMAT